MINDKEYNINNNPILSGVSFILNIPKLLSDQP